jgi:hypothetical protein
MRTLVYSEGQLVGILDGRAVPPAEAGACDVVYEITADDVRDEAQRRMMALVGARDVEHLDLILVNGLREVARLLRIGEANWAPAEARRASELEAVDAGIEKLREISNRLEVSLPGDFNHDRHWLVSG